MTLQIIKKDGRIEEFDIDKVENAAYKALVGVHNKSADEIASKVAESVEDTLEAFELPRVSFDVVHNLVEFALMDYDKSAAKHYICYRKDRQNVRDGYDSLMAAIKQISKETSKENANIHMSPSSKMYETGSEANKEYVLNHVLPSHVAYAHRRGLLHQHDLNYYQWTSIGAVGQ